MVPARFAVEYPRDVSRFLDYWNRWLVREDCWEHFRYWLLRRRCKFPTSGMKEHHPLHRKGRDSDFIKLRVPTDRKRLCRTPQLSDGRSRTLAARAQKRCNCAPTAFSIAR